jgi:hypothetical protein
MIKLCLINSYWPPADLHVENAIERMPQIERVDDRDLYDYSPGGQPKGVIRRLFAEGRCKPCRPLWVTAWQGQG